MITSQSLFREWNLLHDVGIVGHFEKTLSKSKFDIQALRRELKEEVSFSASCTRSYKDFNPRLSFSDRTRLLSSALEYRSKQAFPILVFLPLSLSLISLAISISDFRSFDKTVIITIAAILILGCFLYTSYITRIRLRLYDALLIIQEENRKGIV